MSVVSGVVLFTSVCESENDDFDGGPNWKRVNDWLVEHGFAALAFVDQHASGTKAMQMHVGCGGFNYFREDEFAAFVLSLRWEIPENVVLVIEPEDGATRVWRPGVSKPEWSDKPWLLEHDEERE